VRCFNGTGLERTLANGSSHWSDDIKPFTCHQQKFMALDSALSRPSLGGISELDLPYAICHMHDRLRHDRLSALSRVMPRIKCRAWQYSLLALAPRSRVLAQGVAPTTPASMRRHRLCHLPTYSGQVMNAGPGAVVRDAPGALGQQVRRLQPAGSNSSARRGTGLQAGKSPVAV